MRSSETINKIILLPKMFTDLGNISIYELLKQSGYFQNFNQITEKDIFNELSHQPERIKEWILYSENKRSDSGYFIEQKEKDSYIVGYFSLKGGRRDQTEYHKGNEACAAFIKHEIEEIRNQK